MKAVFWWITETLTLMLTLGLIFAFMILLQVATGNY